jgi:hypothetical protein
VWWSRPHSVGYTVADGCGATGQQRPHCAGTSRVRWAPRQLEALTTTSPLLPCAGRATCPLHFHTSHISHIRANTQHELLTADFASPHSADGPAYTGRPVAHHLQLRLGLCARQRNQSQPSLRTRALSGTPDRAFCRRVRHPPPAHSPPALYSCPPKPPAPLSAPKNPTPRRAPAPGSLSHSLLGHKTACAETVSRRPCCHTRTPHPNTSMQHRSRHPSAPAPTPQPSPSRTLSGEVLVVARAPVAPGTQHSAATCTERFGPRCRGDENGYHLRPTSSAPTSTSTSTGHPDSQFRCPDGHSARKLGCGATNKGAVLLPMLVQPKAAPATAHNRLERTQARPPKPEPPSQTPPRLPRHPHHRRCQPRRRSREKHAQCADAAPVHGSGACSGSRDPQQHTHCSQHFSTKHNSGGHASHRCRRRGAGASCGKPTGGGRL